VLLAVVAAQPASSAGVEDFYKGKTVSLLIGYSVGGGYDAYGRLVARHLGKHIPGNPLIIVKNMPGAAGLVLLNSLANTMPKDGTMLATFDRAIPLEYVLNPSKVRFDPLNLT